jgi:archaellum component FlaC
MSLIIETDLKEFLSNLERKIDQRFDKIDQRFDKIDQRFDKIDQRLDTMQDDITTLKLGQNDLRNEIKLVQTKLEGDIKSLDTKGSVIQPIITGLTVTFAGGILLAIYKYLPA